MASRRTVGFASPIALGNQTNDFPQPVKPEACRGPEFWLVCWNSIPLARVSLTDGISLALYVPHSVGTGSDEMAQRGALLRGQAMT